MTYFRPEFVMLHLSSTENP